MTELQQLAMKTRVMDALNVKLLHENWSLPRHAKHLPQLVCDLCVSHEALRIKLAQAEAAMQQDGATINTLQQGVGNAIRDLESIICGPTLAARIAETVNLLRGLLTPDEIDETELPN